MADFFLLRAPLQDRLNEPRSDIVSMIARLTLTLESRYRVERELGAGGMATVYLAHDLKHERDVAIKVLYPDLGAALGAERFLSEIKTTAKLQHPHILPLLDSGTADGLLYYVMPLVTGETLRARLEREGQLPVDDAVRLAREIASALEHAHRQGIIHRDIKPENILLQDGAAVVADFGIALAVQSAGGARMTQTGLSLGTPQYMSPEQATGERMIDARSDIYALGAVTYEMLAGEPPFSGPTVQAVVARLLADMPRPLMAQRKAVPLAVDVAVLRALEKLPADRFASAAAFSAALDATDSRSAHRVARQPSAPRVRVMAFGVAACAALVAGVGGWWLGRGATSGAGGMEERITVDATVGMLHRVRGEVDISRDGRQIAAIATDSSGVEMIRIRDLSSDSLRTVAGTEGARGVNFSPDGTSLLFTGTTLRRVATAGGTSIQLASSVFDARAHWGTDGWVYYTDISGSIGRVRENGGSRETLTTIDTARHEFAHWEPQLLPGGKAVLFFAYTGPADSSRVEAYDLKTRRRTVLIPRASNPRFVTGGFLTFIRNGALLAVRFDEKRLRIEGDPMPVLSDVAFDVSNGSAAYAVSTQGTLAYVRQSDADAPQLLREVGRDGRDGELLTTKGKWAEPRLSPDGRYLAATLRSSPWQIWLLDRSRRVLSQLTRSAGASFSPNWAPDGKSLVHVAETPVYDVVRTLLDGSSVDTLSRTSRDKFATSVGPDGRTFAFSQLLEHDDVFVQTGRDAPRAIMTGPDARQGATISPDGRWIAYVERSAGRRAEVYVQSLTSASRRQVSSEGGDQPRWTKQGGELVYRRGDAMLSATFDPVTGEPSRPIELFRRLMAGQMSDGRTTGFDVSADGLRFYIVEPQQPERRATVALIFNWRRDLERALPR